MNFTHISSTSTADSFKNYTSKQFSVAIPSQNIAAGGYVGYAATTTLNNSNSISQVQLKYTGIESFYRVLNGVPTVNKTTYQAQSFYYFSSTTLTVYTIISNLSASTITIPGITADCRAFLFLAPF